MSEHNSRLMSIGEVAKSLHITRRMILNYEDKGILLPDVKTGSGGNRYYTPETLTRIRAIRRLQTLGISLDEIKLYFEDAADLRDIIARLEKLRDELNLCIEKLQLRVRENSNEAPIIRTIPTPDGVRLPLPLPYGGGPQGDLPGRDPRRHAPVRHGLRQADVLHRLPYRRTQRHQLLCGGAGWQQGPLCAGLAGGGGSVHLLPRGL